MSIEDNSRRFFLKSAAGVGLLFSPLGNLARSAVSMRAMPSGKTEGDFLRHNDIPWALEVRRSSFGFGPLTPESHFFVRNNLPMPSPDILAQRDSWQFGVEGAERSGSLTLAELKAMNPITIATVIQCSGNGRAFFPHHPSGSEWVVGAAGCALWTGVRVADVLARFGGAKEGLEFLTTTGAESIPEGIDADQVAVERSVPIEKALKDCLLVWEMNGAPLSLAHGGPLRLIVPGYFGVNNVKWVKRLAATEGQSSAKIQQSGYRLRDIGESGGPQHPSMFRMPVKSWLNGPGADDAPILAGNHALYGVAFSGERGIKQVEVSVDNGQHWQQAEFVGPDLGINAWRAFKFPLDLGVGKHRAVCRAQDGLGDWQPRERKENERGYGHNGWKDHGLSINVVSQLPVTTVAAASVTAKINETAKATPVSDKPISLSATAQRGRELFLTKAQPGCGVCHTLNDAGAQGAVGPNLNQLQPSLSSVRQSVSQGVGIMPAYGDQLNSQELDALATYVFETTR